jgi:hypothetical protein
MSSTVPAPPGPMPEPTARRRSVDRVKIATYPNIVFLYPSIVVALLAAIFLTADVGSERVWTLAFLIALGVNLIVLAFDFPRTTSLTILFLVIAAVLGAILLNQRVELFPRLADWLRDLQPRANDSFFWLYAIFGILILLIVFINHRYFDFYVIESNEILHHHGLLGDMDRIPSPGVRLQKEILDIFEFMLLRSGRLIITPQSGGLPIVLDAVPRINTIERQLNEILGVTEVEINRG